MKCEICHKADAQAAITREKDGVEEELYVCNACAKKEREQRQKRSQRTRKVTGLPPGMSMSITEISSVSSDDADGETPSEGGETPPPIIGAIMNAFSDMVSDIEKAHRETKKSEPKKAHEMPAKRADAAYRVRDGFHLEALSLIGELDAVKRALHALKMDLAGYEADGIHEAGHVYRLTYTGSPEQARRVANDLLREERNARVRLFEEMPRVFGDAVCRALSILKNCRLLSPGEFFDLLSPLRLAAFEKLLDGITLADIERHLARVDLANGEDKLEPDERDRVDAERADEMNARFADVVLNEKAEEKYL